MSKEWNPAYGTEDPENRLFWRVPYRRLEVEAIRDSMLAVSGRLNPRMYGPSMYPYVPPAALEGSSDPDKIWRPFDEADASRRTIYAFVKRSMIVPLLEVLDLCDTTKSSAERINTAVPTQALTLFNGEFVNRQARHLAERLIREAGPDPGDRIERRLSARIRKVRQPRTSGNLCSRFCARKQSGPPPNQTPRPAPTPPPGRAPAPTPDARARKRKSRRSSSCAASFST